MGEKLLNTLLDAAEEVLGLPKDEISEDIELDLFENDLIDSIGCVAMMNYVEDEFGKKINIEDMEPDDFTSISTMNDALIRMFGL